MSPPRRSGLWLSPTDYLAGAHILTGVNEQGEKARSFVVGTAGHVDHGKSTLVKALTGIDPDRLAEEKARAMTIELGFAWLRLPSGREVGIVDVPGHERFIKAMLAGVGGIDAALLIVAADEGPMPQTMEHLAILDLLHVSRGVVVLTKEDAVEADWLDLVREEVRERIDATTLTGSPIVAVSALTGAGLPELKETLDRVLDDAPARSGGGIPRLPVDRVFSVPGFGTVVTGTLLGSSLGVGQEVRVYPGDLVTRVRGVQSHGAKRDRIGPSHRAAVNVATLGVDELRRGDVLAPPGALTSSLRIDVRLRLLPNAPAILEQNAEVDFFAGAAEVSARLTLLDRDTLAPSEEGWVQVRLRAPLALLKGDRYIVRRPSPSDTIGGGEVIDAAPARHRRFRPDVLAALETLAAGDPADVVVQALATAREARSLKDGNAGGLDDSVVGDALMRLLATGQVRSLARHDDVGPRPGDFLIAVESWAGIRAQVEDVVGEFHRTHPLRKGIPKEELKRRLRLTPSRLADDVFASAEDDGVIVDDGQSVRLAAFEIVLEGPRRTLADRYLAAIQAAPNAPPGPTEFGIDVETLGALIDRREVIKVADGVIFAPGAVAEIERDTVDLIEAHGPLTLAAFRDHFGSSRKYAQALLEYFDAQRVTRRVGDERVRYAGVGARAGRGETQ